MHILRYISVIFLIYSVTTIGQVHSGPATGNIASGVEVSTDNFPMVPIGMEPQKEQRVIRYMENDTESIISGIGDPRDYENYIYVEDGNTSFGTDNDVGEHFVLHSFPSIPMTNSIPPDPHMAVGPDHVMSLVNSRFHIYDREGNLLKNIDADAWCTPALPNPGAFDPQIMYDHYEGRWFMLWDSQDDATQTAHFIIAYSDDENPIGTWYMYAIDARTNGNTVTSTWGDYPQIGYDNNAIYINSRQFGFGGGLFYNKIRIIKKSELYAANGGPLSWTDFWNIRDPNNSNEALDVLHPVFSYDELDNTAYFLWARRTGSSTFYVLYKIADPITSPVLTGERLFGVPYISAPNANQLGGGTPIEVNGSHIKTTPVVRDGKLYATHPIRNTQHTTYGSLKYLVIDVNTNTFLEEVEFGAQGYFFLYPAIMVDQDHNIAITYSRSADTEYIGAYYSTKLAADPPGTLSSSHVMMEGQGNYDVTFGGTRNRWGDYLSAALDPVNEYNIWLYSEYAAATNQWGTWLTEIRMEPLSGVNAHTLSPSIDFGDIEVGTTSDIITAILANYGDQDLVIDGIPSSMGEFYLDDTNLNFPITLSTYDSLSLDFTFSPTVPDSVEETFLVTSNDPVFTGFTLSGHGYVINPAVDKVMYASSGPQNDGNLLFIDTQTGAGTNIGPSLFSDILSLTISPLNDELLGVRSIPSESEILRVNSLGGDAYLLHSLDLGNIVAIAFDTSGVLYGALETGDIYSIDLTNGTYQYVSTALIELTAITFEPMTNDLWATIQGGFGVPKDQIFKIDLATGDTTLVGLTGFNTLTNGLAFDENGVLYGIKGSGPTVSDLFTIDVNTGEGTIVGSVGMMALTGLAFAETGFTVSVDDSDDKSIPTEFVLSQNYPNPFNPSTSIEFSVPVNSDVTLTIYNLLGQIVTTLVNEDKPAGKYSVEFNATGLPSGVYFYKLEAGSFLETKKMILLK